MMAPENRQAVPIVTDWRAVFSGLFGGVAAALQIGKAAGALPLLREEFAADITVMAAYVGLISMVAAVGGLWFGSASGRRDPKRFGQAGLAVIVAGTVVAVMAPNVGVLLVSRCIEAIGFSMVVTTMPTIVQAAAGPERKSVALGIWATWLPIGVAAALGLSWVLIETAGWRSVYLATMAITFGAAVGLELFVPKVPPQSRPAVAAHPFTVFRPEPLKLMFIFLVFSAASLIFVGFMPAMLVDEFAAGEAQASAMSIVAVLAITPTAVIGGWLLGRGVSARWMFVASLCAMAVLALTLFASTVPDAARLAAMVLFGLATGIPPALVWASTSTLARSSGAPQLLSGLFYQGAGLGQVAGPPLAGWAVAASGGWIGAGWVATAFVLVGAGTALTLRTGGVGR